MRLVAMVDLDRQEIFRFIIPRLSFHSRAEKNQVLTYLMMRAVNKQHTDLALFVLKQDFRVQLRDYSGIWQPPEKGSWKLEELKQFVSERRDQVSALTPTAGDMALVRDPEHVVVLVHLARHCDNLRDQHTFDATKFLVNLVCTNTFLNDAKLAESSYILIGLGAKLDQHVLGKFEIYREEALPLLQEMLYDIKEPESD
jgi:hypothetical protein